MMIDNYKIVLKISLFTCLCLVCCSTIYAQVEGEYVYNREEFLREAFSSSKKEVQLAQRVQRKANNQAVKTYADTLEEDHNDAIEELIQLARRNRWSVPEEMLPNHIQEVERLSNFTGDLLEKNYLNAMVTGHQQMIDKFRAAMLSARDEELGRWIGNQIPVMQKHLDKAHELLKKSK